jgi:very-short-patch-repair endonuclease
MPSVHNKISLKPFRKYLRNHSAAAEATLWNILKNRNLCNIKFRRQHSVGNFILDFYCPELKLGIELDGEYHADPAAITYDSEREEFLKKFSIQILRYENRWVYEYPDVIIHDIIEIKEKMKLDPTTPLKSVTGRHTDNNILPNGFEDPS